MKFLEKLKEHYQTLGVEVPDWLNEAEVTGSPIGGATPGSTPQAGQQPSVVGQFMKAVEVMGDDPDVQKLKATVTQKVTDAKKVFTDTGTKVVDTIDKAMQGLNNIAGSAGAATATTASNIAANAAAGAANAGTAVGQVGVK
ncbi:MAG: hypothetical protein EBU90_03210 [Proteobacteria bacterium]|nr:hypothetical protein [Pseudomonadota bacterium]NBP13335.1 hypothetical protein [bacterium]